MPIAKRKPKGMAPILRVPKVRFDVLVRRGGRKEIPSLMASRTQKREAMRAANRRARREPVPRQVSVYRREVRTQRSTLIYQVHYSPKLGRLIAEEL